MGKNNVVEKSKNKIPSGQTSKDGELKLKIKRVGKIEIKTIPNNQVTSNYSNPYHQFGQSFFPPAPQLPVPLGLQQVKEFQYVWKINLNCAFSKVSGELACFVIFKHKHLCCDQCDSHSMLNIQMSLLALTQNPRYIFNNPANLVSYVYASIIIEVVLTTLNTTYIASYSKSEHTFDL